MTVDLDLYFRRIGYDGERTPTLATLRALHELHPRAIAFENLDPLLGRPVRLDAGSLTAKMLQGGRGGYCFEQNLLFGYVLRTLGFKLRELLGRPRWQMPDGVVTPRMHMLLLVELEGAEHIADVGFGGNTLTGPLRLQAEEAQPTPHEPARLIRLAGQWATQFNIRGGWVTGHVFDLSQQYPIDWEMSNWWTSTNADSPFASELRAARTETDGRHALRNNELARHRLNGETRRSTLRTVAELRDVLADVFKLRLTGLAGLDNLLARVAAGEARRA